MQRVLRPRETLTLKFQPCDIVALHHPSAMLNQGGSNVGTPQLLTSLHCTRHRLTGEGRKGPGKKPHQPDLEQRAAGTNNVAAAPLLSPPLVDPDCSHAACASPRGGGLRSKGLLYQISGTTGCHGEFWILHCALKALTRVESSSSRFGPSHDEVTNFALCRDGSLVACL